MPDDNGFPRQLNELPPRRSMTLVERCATRGEAEDIQAEIENAKVLLQIGGRRYRGQVEKAVVILSLRGGIGYVVNVGIALEAVGELTT